MKKLFYKLFSKAERALMMKDLSALCRRRLILTLLIALPLVFAVAFPLLFLFVSAMVSPKSSGVEQFKNLLDNIPQGTDERAQMFYIFTAFISPMLFMLIPLLSAIITASYTFAGERAHGTMETLLFAPFSVRRFLQVKAASSILASGLVTAVSFILFFVVTAIGDMVLKAPFFVVRSGVFALAGHHGAGRYVCCDADRESALHSGIHSNFRLYRAADFAHFHRADHGPVSLK